ncbi:glycoside hydrolase family 43 protein (plasmid) [Deinococcus radiomollis]|uniref:glycoside hydrolase family 43 protein n=1 Tax=Deinococcus radiomollis TaxID=468916 RepID=UPI003891BC79
MRRRLAALAGLLLGLPLTLAATAPQSSSTPQLSNPVIAEDFADPDLLRFGREYYAYSTNTGGVNAPVFRSADLQHWRSLGDALPVLPAWASGGNTWAPDVLAVRGGYAMYFTARHTASGRQCIGVAFSVRPQGPFVSRSAKPLVCQLDEGGSIDASGFTDKDGRLYLYWKNDGNCCNQLTGLWVQPLAADGQSLTGKPHDLIYNAQLWEGSVIEAPFMYLHAGRYYLFYSGGTWDSDTYAVGYAVGTSPLGPFKKSPDNPLLMTSGKVAGPGGEGVLTDARGHVWMYYHGWEPQAIGYPVGGRRALYFSPLKWNGTLPVVR